MKFLRLLLLAGCCLLPAARTRAADDAARLETLKGQFPALQTKQVEIQLAGKRKETVEVKSPAQETWAKYHGMVAAATLATLPGVITRIEAAIKADDGVLRNQQKTLVGHGAKAQARETSQWLDGQFTAYLGKLKPLAPSAK